jgi:hypothetical protein
VGFGYNTGPKLEYLQNRTTFVRFLLPFPQIPLRLPLVFFSFSPRTSPFLQLMQRNGEWCAQTDTTPRYIDSNSAQKFEVGQKLEVSLKFYL